MSGSSEVTRALEDMSSGDPDALERLLPIVYDQLRRIADGALRQERPDHTLSATALVHETYLKLAQLDRISWEGRAHFFGAAASAMRRILISYARTRKRGKRGGGAAHVAVEDVVVAARERPEDLMALDEALERLAARNPRQSRVVECRYFAGMTVEETAAALGVSPITIKRDWTVARAWLHRELAPDAGTG